MAMASPTPAAELLEGVRPKRRHHDVKLKDVEELLANETFTSDMLATTDQGVSE